MALWGHTRPWSASSGRDGQAGGVASGGEHLAQVGESIVSKIAQLRDSFMYSKINNRNAKDYSFSNTRQPMFALVRQLIIPDSAG